MFKNALAAYKNLEQDDASSVDLGHDGRKMKTKSTMKHREEEDKKDDEDEDKEGRKNDKNDDGTVPAGSKASDEDKGLDDNTELDAELGAIFNDNNDNDNPQELMECKVVKFIKFIQPLKHIKYVLL